MAAGRTETTARAGRGATGTGPPTAGRGAKGIALLTGVRAVRVVDGHPTAGRDRKGIGRLTADRAGKAIGRHSNVPGGKGANPSKVPGGKAIGRHSNVRASTALDLKVIAHPTRAALEDSPSTALRAMIDHRAPTARGRTARAQNARLAIARGKIDRVVTAVRLSIGRADRVQLAEGIGRGATSAARQGNTPRARSERRVLTRQNSSVRAKS